MRSGLQTLRKRANLRQPIPSLLAIASNARSPSSPPPKTRQTFPQQSNPSQNPPLSHWASKGIRAKKNSFPQLSRHPLGGFRGRIFVFVFVLFFVFFFFFVFVLAGIAWQKMRSHSRFDKHTSNPQSALFFLQSLRKTSLFLFPFPGQNVHGSNHSFQQRKRSIFLQNKVPAPVIGRNYFFYPVLSKTFPLWGKSVDP